MTPLTESSPIHPPFYYSTYFSAESNVRIPYWAGRQGELTLNEQKNKLLQEQARSKAQMQP